MILHKYGEFSENQIAETKKYIRKRIFFLLLIVDKKTKDDYPNINVSDAFYGLQAEIAGLNSLLFFPTEIVRTLSLLEAAWIEYNKDNFSYSKYRKLIFDAGSEIEKIKEV